MAVDVGTDPSLGPALQGASPNPKGDQVLHLAGSTQGPESLDPALAKDLPTAFLIRQIYRGLMRLGPDLQPVPELAERVDVSPDGLVYTFTLRQNTAFHDGRALIADDVVFSFTHHLDPNTAGGQAALLGTAAFLGDIAGAADMLSGAASELAGVKALDEATVEITLTEPRAAFLMKVAAAQTSIIDQADVQSKPDWWRTPNGSGPFRLIEWKPDDHMTLERFDAFFGGTPSLRRVEIALGPKANQSFNLYQSDKIEITDVPFDAVSRVADANNPLRAELTSTPALGVLYVAFRTDTPPLDDPHVRRAIFQGFPRDKVADLTFNDTVSHATGLLPNGLLDRNWSVTVDAYDLDAAKSELAASKYAGRDDIPPIQIFTSSGISPVDSLRQVLEEDLGLTVEVIEPDWPEFIDGLALRRFPAYSWFWGADYPDPENFLWTLFGSDGPDNYLSYQNPAMDALIAQARVESDVEKRANLYAQANQLLADDFAVMPFYYGVNYTLAKPYVRGLEVTMQGIIRLETIWLEH